MAAEREFKIKITGDASGATAAADQTKDSLNGLSAKTSQYIDKLKEQAAETGKVEISHRELHESIRKLTEISPELGIAARFALNPWIAGLIAVGYTIDLIQEKWKAEKEALEEQIDPSSIQAIVDALGTDGLAKALGDSEAAADAFIEKLNRIASSQTTIKQNTDATIESMKHQFELTKSERQAQEDLALATIKAAEAAGKITHAEAISQEGAVRSKFAKGAFGQSDFQERAVINQKQKEADDLQKNINEGRGDLILKQQASDEAKQRAEDLQKEADARKKGYDDEFEATQKGIKSGGLTGDNLRNARIEEGNLYALFVQAQEKANLAKGPAEIAKADFDKFSSQLTANQEALRALTDELARLNSEHAANVESRRVVGQAEDQSRRLGIFTQEAGTPEGKEITSAAHTAQLVEQGKLATDAAKAQLISIASMLAGHNVTLKQAADLFQHAADNDQALLHYIQAIDKRLIQIQSSANANRGALSGG